MDYQSRFILPVNKDQAIGTGSFGYAATYKFLDLGYRPAQSHPQIFLLALIMHSLEVPQLVLQTLQLAILLEAFVTCRRAVARTMYGRVGRELKHEGMGEVCGAFATRFIICGSHPGYLVADRSFRQPAFRRQCMF